jgi:sugar/nucleoside kinase (ribokinase family)
VRRLAVVGNLSLDRVEGGPARVGGPPFYAGLALRALAVPAVIAAKCAEADRSTLLPPLLALGVPVEWRAAASTATFSFRYDADLRTMGVEALGEPWSVEEAEGWVARAVGRAGWIHVGALARGEFPPETLAALAARGARRLSLDGQGLVRPARTGPLELDPDADPEVLRHVAVLKLSEEEAVALVGRIDERSLDELGVPEVVVTLGSRGALVLTRRRLVHVPAHALDGVDPTGAGDAFAAAYVVARSRGQAPLAAGRRATAVVASVLTRR